MADIDQPWSDEELDKLDIGQLQKMQSNYRPQAGIGRAAVSGLEQGTIGAMTAIPEMADWGLDLGAKNLPGDWGKTAATLKTGFDPFTYEPVKERYEAKHGQFYQPQNLPESFVQSATEAVPGMAVGGLGSLAVKGPMAAARTIGRGLAGSAGSELLGKLSEGYPWENAGRMLGFMTGYHSPKMAGKFLEDAPLHTGGGFAGATAAAAIAHLLGAAGTSSEHAILGGILGPEAVHMIKALKQEPWQATKDIAAPAAMMLGTPIYGRARSVAPEGQKQKGEE
jgi:hypothetical protein